MATMHDILDAQWMYDNYKDGEFLSPHFFFFLLFSSFYFDRRICLWHIEVPLPCYRC